MDGVDGIIEKYSQVLQGIYDSQTAGSHTFTGVLSSFLHDLPDRAVLDSDELLKAIRIAVHDPGRVTPRGDDYQEELWLWITRAVYLSVIKFLPTTTVKVG